MTTALHAVGLLLRGHRKFVLTTHVNPDGDGIGSQVALASWLRSQEKDVHIINPNATPAVYRFLDPRGEVAQYDPGRDSPAIAEAEVIVVIDTNHPDRLRAMSDRITDSPALKVCIDHHLDPAPFAQYYLVDEAATSAGELIYRLLLHLQGPDLSAEIATGLYCAIMTDTGSFRYPRVNAETHRIVAHLLSRGADPVRIYGEVYERWSGGRIHLLGETLANLRTGSGGRLAHVTITREMLLRTGTSEEDTENFTNYPMSIDGVQVGIMFLELPGEVKISFRSKGTIPINELAMEFGGNGHVNAAGARVCGGMPREIRERVLAAAERYVAQEDLP